MQKLPFKVDLRCLESGQSFRWKRNGLNEWTGLIDKSIVTFKQVEQTVEFDVRLGPTDIAKQVFDYFQLKEDWDNLLDSWRLDSNFSKVSVGFENLRILRQDPVENVFSFICSSNNNISRITSMIDNLCKKYGEYVGTIEQIDHYTFPQPQQLVDSEETLRELGFGYRAKYIQGAARLLVQKGKDYLYSLREMSYEQAKEELLQIPGGYYT
jgi:N-glycosylase/DNA lyase